MASCGFRFRVKSAHGALMQSQSVRSKLARNGYKSREAKQQRAKRGEATPQSRCRDNLEGAVQTEVRSTYLTVAIETDGGTGTRRPGPVQGPTGPTSSRAQYLYLAASIRPDMMAVRERVQVHMQSGCARDT